MLDVMCFCVLEIVFNIIDGIWYSDECFFCWGGSGDWQQFFIEVEYLCYYYCINQLVLFDLLVWVYEGCWGYDLVN